MVNPFPEAMEVIVGHSGALGYRYSVPYYVMVSLTTRGDTQLSFIVLRQLYCVMWPENFGRGRPRIGKQAMWRLSNRSCCSYTLESVRLMSAAIG